jgi:hypothetical protein
LSLDLRQLSAPDARPLVTPAQQERMGMMQLAHETIGHAERRRSTVRVERRQHLEPASPAEAGERSEGPPILWSAERGEQGRPGLQRRLVTRHLARLGGTGESGARVLYGGLSLKLRNEQRGQ